MRRIPEILLFISCLIVLVIVFIFYPRSSDTPVYDLKKYPLTDNERFISDVHGGYFCAEYELTQRSRYTLLYYQFDQQGQLVRQDKMPYLPPAADSDADASSDKLLIVMLDDGLRASLGGHSLTWPLNEMGELDGCQPYYLEYVDSTGAVLNSGDQELLLVILYSNDASFSEKTDRLYPLYDGWEPSSESPLPIKDSAIMQTCIFTLEKR